MLIAGKPTFSLKVSISHDSPLVGLISLSPFLSSPFLLLRSLFFESSAFTRRIAASPHHELVLHIVRSVVRIMKKKRPDLTNFTPLALSQLFGGSLCRFSDFLARILNNVHRSPYPAGKSVILHLRTSIILTSEMRQSKYFARCCWFALRRPFVDWEHKNWQIFGSHGLKRSSKINSAKSFCY